MYENTPKVKRSLGGLPPAVHQQLFIFQYNENASLAYRFRIGKYEYTTKDYLAEGFSSKVYRANLINNKKQRFAIKVIDLSKFEMSERELLDTQIQIITSLNHPNIIKCVDVYQTTKNYFLVTEYCPHGDLAQLIQLQKYLAEDMAVQIMKQILDGYKYLMSKNILHRDLKPSNVMRFGNVWKIGDFGFAKYCKEECLLQKLYVGTPFYMPPESLQVHKYSIKSDIFALGIIFYEILTGETPWPANTEKELLESMKQKELTIPQLLKSEQVKYFLKHTIVIDYYQRMGKQEFKKFSLDNIDMDELSKIKSKGVSSHLKRELSKSGKKSYIFGTPSKINKNSFFCNSLEKESTNSDITKTCGHQNISPYQDYEYICDSNNRKIKQNYEIMSNQLELAKIISSIVSGLKIFALKCQEESFLSIVMTKLAIKMLKMISNKRQNYYRFHKWDVFKQSEKYSTCCIMIYSYISKLELELEGIAKNEKKSMAQLINNQIPQLTQNNNISFKVYAQLFQHLRRFITTKLLNSVNEGMNQEKKCYIIRQILELMIIIKNRSTRQQQIKGFGLKSKPESTHAKKGLWSKESYRSISKQLLQLCSKKIPMQ